MGPVVPKQLESRGCQPLNLIIIYIIFFVMYSIEDGLLGFSIYNYICIYVKYAFDFWRKKKSGMGMHFWNVLNILLANNRCNRLKCNYYWLEWSLWMSCTEVFQWYLQDLEIWPACQMPRFEDFSQEGCVHSKKWFSLLWEKCSCILLAHFTGGWLLHII